MAIHGGGEMNEDYKPRFSFEISREQQVRADRLLSQYGLRKPIFGKILDDVLDLIEEHGGMAIGILMSPAVENKEIIPSMKKVDMYKKGD